MDRKFLVASQEEIKRGGTTDIYFIRTVDILRKEGRAEAHVDMEITSGGLPYGFTWGVLAGTYEAINLLEGLPVTLRIMPEGTIFKPYDYNGVRVPIGYVSGRYIDFSIYETPLLGLLSQATGVATYAAHLRYHAWDKTLLAFGARRMHPAITPMLDYAAYIGGFDGVSSILSAKILGMRPMGTMPHALIIIMGSQEEAWKAFDRHVERGVPRIALIDTFADEKTEAIKAAETLGERLNGVRLDTPGSRRGDIATIIREVRWELDLRGYRDVKIFLSGGVDIELVKRLGDAPVDGYGVGASLSNARIVDFALDIVQLNNKPIAKRGKFSGVKEVYRCRECYEYLVLPRGNEVGRCPRCGGEMEEMLVTAIEKGEKRPGIEEPKMVRERVLRQLERIKSLGWGD